ncbi:hypothetical protein K8I61_09520 [bacterium]|nr:hypothetical protein [bacterium]
MSAAACAPTDATWQRHLVALDQSAKSALLLSLPDRIVVSRAFDTGAEISIESLDVPVDLSAWEAPLAERMRSSLLADHPDWPLVAASGAAPYLSALPGGPDPDDGRAVEPVRSWPAPGRFERASYRPAADLRPRSDFEPILFRSHAPFQNAGRNVFRRLDARRAHERLDVAYLVLVELTDIERRSDAAGGARVVAYHRIVSLRDGLMITEERNEFSAARSHSVIGPSLANAGANDLAVDIESVRRATAAFAERYPVVMAWQLGLIDDAAAASRRATW